MKKVALIILDGWGIGSNNSKENAIAAADTPYMDHLLKSYPNSKLTTSGEKVGLPEGQMGNSEVGHMNIGAGRIIDQPILRINKSIRNKELHKNKVLLKAFEYAIKEDKKIHLLGLVSDGGVHSHIDHLKALLDISSENNASDRTFVHAFTDGRDTDPHAGKGYIEELSNHLINSGGKIASIIGRYFAMDRDKRWERVKKAWDLLVKGEGTSFSDPVEAMNESYKEGFTDEFIEPRVICDENGQPLAKITEGDVVIFFNFRTDRGRQLTAALTQQDFPDQEMHALKLYYITMTQYDESFRDIHILFDEKNIDQTLGEVISKEGLHQLRVAETEKYPHVTFFFNGGREKPFENETRLMVNSPKVATYDLKPEMSAPEVTEKTVNAIREEKYELLILNYANADMVGHTGDYEAIVRAVETVDEQNKILVEACLEHGYDVLVTSDHGNADYVRNEDGSPNTAHTTNKVPFIYISGEKKKVTLNDGKLGDIAPTILGIMNIEKPQKMTGQNLIDEK